MAHFLFPFLCPFTSLFVVLLVVVVWCWMRIRLQRLCFDLVPYHGRLGMTRGQRTGNSFIVPNSLTLVFHCVYGGPEFKFMLLNEVPRPSLDRLSELETHLSLLLFPEISCKGMWWQRHKHTKNTNTIEALYIHKPDYVTSGKNLDKAPHKNILQWNFSSQKWDFLSSTTGLCPQSGSKVIDRPGWTSLSFKETEIELSVHSSSQS